MDARYRAALPLFEYDTDAPLALRTIDSTDRDGITVDEVSFASPSGATGHGLVVTRRPAAGQPALVMAFPGHARDLLDRADNFARLGLLVVVLDPPQVRRGGPLTRFTAADRDEQIELMLQLRRAVDVALEAGADPNRIAYWGYSWGCAMGVQLAGIEHRIGSFVLMYCDGGVVEHFTGPDGAEGELARLAKAQSGAWIKVMEPIEPLYFVGHAAPSALFFQNGTRDEVVLPEDAKRLHAAASEPKEVHWYDTGHEGAPPEVWCDQAEWLKGRLELTSSDIPECR
jgi:predicted esterase